MHNRKRIAMEFAEQIKTDCIEKIILFGSVARGDDNDDSDIDILIVSDYYENIDPLITDIVGEFVLIYKELISVHVMSVERFRTTQDYSFLSNVLEEGVVLV